MRNPLRYRKLRKWINLIIIINGLLFLIVGFTIWMSYVFSQNTFFYLTLITTVSISCYTLFFIINTTLGFLTKKKKLESLPINIFTTALLVFISYTYILSAYHVRPAKKLECSFDLQAFKNEIKKEFKADSVIIIS